MHPNFEYELTLAKIGSGGIVSADTFKVAQWVIVRLIDKIKCDYERCPLDESIGNVIIKKIEAEVDGSVDVVDEQSDQTLDLLVASHDNEGSQDNIPSHTMIVLSGCCCHHLQNVHLVDINTCLKNYFSE